MLPGAKITMETNREYFWKPGRKSWGESVLGELQHYKISLYTRNLKPYAQPRIGCMLKTTTNTDNPRRLPFHLRLILKAGADLQRACVATHWRSVSAQSQSAKIICIYFFVPGIQEISIQMLVGHNVKTNKQIKNTLQRFHLTNDSL